MGDQPYTKPLITYRTTETWNKHAQSSRPQVELELTISLSQHANTIRDVDLSIAIDNPIIWQHINLFSLS
jgi:hypothetical protein